MAMDVQQRTAQYGHRRPDEEIVKITAHIVLNLFTSYLNVALDVPVDLPGFKLTRGAA
ncbi:hypothetical protein [Pararhizobium sp. PWRC1-1]|uniref:hypothetical protein n=1 Tax=Pararhizobium sp. PWRC1-1 TaxID=2804566 RepID=UPI003CF4CB84